MDDFDDDDGGLGLPDDDLQAATTWAIWTWMATPRMPSSISRPATNRPDGRAAVHDPVARGSRRVPRWLP